MKKNSFEKGSEMYEMYGEYFRISKELMDGDETGERPDAYWDMVLETANAFYAKFPCEFAKSLVLALINELERRHNAEVKEKEAMFHIA